MTATTSPADFLDSLDRLHAQVMVKSNRARQTDTAPYWEGQSTRTAVLSWDWREQPDLGALARALLDVSEGTVFLHQVGTGGDEYAVVLADRALDKNAVWAAYQERP